MWIIGVIAILLASCTSYEQRVANTCARLGMGPGEPEYNQCVLEEMNNDSRERAAWSGVTNTGAYMMHPPTYVIVP